MNADVAHYYFDLDASIDGVLDLPEGRHDLLVQVVVHEAVQGGVGDGAGHPQEVAGHVGHHQRLCSQDIRPPGRGRTRLLPT